MVLGRMAISFLTAPTIRIITAKIGLGLIFCLLGAVIIPTLNIIVIN